MSQTHPPRRLRFAPLRHAAAWLLYGSMRAIVLLPFPWQLSIGRAAGRLAGWLARSRHRVVLRNLELCLPELDDARRAAIARAHFEALGASVVEMAMGWYGDRDAIERRVSVEGREHLERAIAAGRGVILYSAHFTPFEIFFPVLAPMCPRFAGMYKAQRNPIVNRVMSAGRGRNVDRLFDKESVRDMVRELRANTVVWYASDQSYTGKGSRLLPFFGVPAMTNTAIGRIARLSGATVLPYFCRRLPDGDRYLMSIGAPLEGFPSGDDDKDTLRLVALIEEHVRQCPEQYWWVHKRFKGRPAPLPDPYVRRGAPTP